MLTSETPRLVFKAMRPLQWTKNSIVFAGLIFGGKMFHFFPTLRALFAFLLFCILSGCVYLVNDITDRHRDSIHPEKRNRPIASGRLSVTEATWAAILLGSIACLASLFLGRNFFLCSLGYLLLMFFYSFSLKRMIILDALVISAGFVLRAAAGAFSVEVEISSWLLACTVVGSCFLAFCKRRAEMDLLDKEAIHHRESLSEYNIDMLDQLTTVCCSATAVCYLLYALSPETTEKFHSNLFFITFFPVLYGLLRYLVLSRKSTEVGRPEKVLLTDVPLIVAVLSWVILVLFIVY